MTGKLQQLQDSYLNTQYSQQVLVAVYRVKPRGHVLSFDLCVVLPKNSLPRRVCKHSIAAVLPARMRNAGTAHASA